MIILCSSFLASQGSGVPPGKTSNLHVPALDIGEISLEGRKAAQMELLKSFPVYAGFHFSDRLDESGITFVQRGVEDSGKAYKIDHYDHGDGIAVADVDGDGLYDIYFCTMLGSNQLWKNLGGGKFRNITGITAMTDRISTAATFADVDNDGDEDLYVSTVRTGNALFLNDGKGGFAEQTSDAGLAYSGHSSGIVMFDYNLDGLLDIFLVNVGKYTTDVKGPGGYYVGIDRAFEGQLHPELSEQSVLYRNRGKDRFVDVSSDVSLVDKNWTGDASFTDFNNDLYPDLYVVNMQGDDHYYENQKGEKFEDKTPKYFPHTPYGTMGIKFFDFNNDGFMDLLLTDMHSDMMDELGTGEEKNKMNRFSGLMWGENSILGDAFFKNQGAGTFQEISDQVGVENYWPWGVSVGDLNADGYDDVFISSGMGFPFRYGINSLLLNNHGKTFLDSEFILGIEPRKGGRTSAPAFELDCDGADKNHKLCKGSTGRLTVYGTLSSRSSAFFDIDNDGDLDIVTNEMNGPPQVLISDLAQKKQIHFLKIVLVGTKSNHDGLGALVKVTSGNSVYTKYNDGKSGYLSQSALPLYFGLSDAKAVDRIEVLWPSGTKQVVTKGIALNQVLKIVEQ